MCLPGVHSVDYYGTSEGSSDFMARVNPCVVGECVAPVIAAGHTHIRARARVCTQADRAASFRLRL